MSLRSTAVLAAISFAMAGFGMNTHAKAQDRLMVKNGESIDIGTVYWISNCRSIMVGLPAIEVLEGPSQVTLGIREEPVLPRRQGCANKVAGGMITLTAKGVSEPTEAKLAYRVNYKTRDGDRQTSRTYLISLYP